MSQKLTPEVVASLKKGDTLYHNVIVFTGEDGEKRPATAKVTGKGKSHPFEDFVLPIKRQYGDLKDGAITKHGADLWRTTPERVMPKHVTRHREAPKEAEGEKPAVKGHVRRTRTRN